MCVRNVLLISLSQGTAPVLASDPTRYTSILDCVRKMARHEGLFSLYKGKTYKPVALKIIRLMLRDISSHFGGNAKTSAEILLI